MSCSGSAVASGSCCCGDRALEGTGVPHCGCRLGARAQYQCAEEDNKYPVSGQRSWTIVFHSACWLCTVHLSIAVVLPLSFLLCVFPDQLIPGVIGLPQHPCSVTNVTQILERKRKRHLTSMPRHSVWETFWMSIFRDIDLNVSHISHASSETGELAR